MSWADAVEDRWGGRNGTVRLLLRLLGVSALTYALARMGSFAGPAWVAVCTALALVVTVGLLVLRTVRPFDRIALALAVVLMVLGIAVNPAVDNLGSIFFVVGGIALVGQPEVPVRLAAGLTAALTAALVLRAVLVDPQWTVLLSNLFGGAAVALFGANRRQRVLRLRETARVTELEERSRLARELHDVLAHSLGGLVVQLDAASAELERGLTAEAAERIRSSRRLAVEGLREARSAVDQLRSGSETTRPGEPVDLVAGLRTVVQGPVGLQLGAELEVIGEPRPVPPEVGRALTATAREALTNVNKHAPGARTAATVEFRPELVRLEVVNGPRAESAGPASDLAATGGGAGLRGLRERLDAVGGRLQTGPEGRRWVVVAECPIPVAAPSGAVR